MNPELFFNVVNFHFRLTELGISGMGMKISLKSVKIWLRYEGLKLTEPTLCNRANSMYGKVSPRVPGSNSELFFNVVNFHFRLTEVGILGMGIKTKILTFDTNCVILMT